MSLIMADLTNSYINVSFQNWSIKYNKAEPIAPRYEINAPDMYIPGKNFL